MTGAGPLRRRLDVADLSAEPTDPSEVDRLAAEVAEIVGSPIRKLCASHKAGGKISSASLVMAYTLQMSATSR